MSRRDAAQRQVLRTLAPNTDETNRFGFGAGGTKPGQAPGETGRGLSSFGLGGASTAGAGKDWKGAAKGTVEDLKKIMEIDLGPAGMTITEKLANGIKAGQGNVEGAAQQIGEGVKGKLAAVDAQADGLKVAQGYAQGILSGAGAVSAAAQQLASAAKAGFAGGGSGGGNFALRNVLSSSTNDGVT
jgi:hypothetical protein